MKIEEYEGRRQKKKQRNKNNRIKCGKRITGDDGKENNKGRGGKKMTGEEEGITKQ